jgi:hypothetical protein
VPHLWSSAFIAETEKGLGRPGRPEIYPGLELVLPGGTVRYAPVGIASAARGSYEARLISPGSIVRTINERTNNLTDLEVEVEVSDAGDRAADRRQLGIRFSTYRQTYRGSVATIRLLSPNVSDADSPIVFSGVLDSAEQVRPMVWRLRLRLNDAPLKFGSVPRAIVSQADWPSADSTALGQYIPIVYGTHDSAGMTYTGFLPTLYVDRLGFRYLVGIGHLKTIRAAYVNGVATTAYTTTYPTVNGKLVTLLDFTAAQTGDVTCDVDGLTDKSDGTGNLITNPADVLSHLLTNFVYGDWRSGEYLAATTAPLHAASFVETGVFLSARGHECSRYLATQQRALDLVNEWADNHQAKVFWTGTGKLAVRMNDPSTTRLYTDEQWFHGDEDEMGAFALRSDTQSLTREVSVPYIYDSAEGQFRQNLIVSDLSVTDKVAVSIEQPWSAARIV